MALILQTIIVQSICILTSATVLWFCLKLFEREISYLHLLILLFLVMCIQIIAMFFENSFFVLLIIYIFSLLFFYFGLFRLSSVKSNFECVLIIIFASAIEKGIGKGLEFIIDLI